MTVCDELDIQVDGHRCYPSMCWKEAIRDFLDQCTGTGGKICFGGKEGFCLYLDWEPESLPHEMNCVINLWSTATPPPIHTLNGTVLYSNSEWGRAVPSLQQFVDDDSIQMLVIVCSHTGTREFRLWKQDDGSLGFGGTFGNQS